MVAESIVPPGGKGTLEACISGSEVEDPLMPVVVSDGSLPVLTPVFFSVCAPELDVVLSAD